MENICLQSFFTEKDTKIQLHNKNQGQINQLIFINLGKEVEIKGTSLIFLIELYIHYLYKVHDSIDSMESEESISHVGSFISDRCLVVRS